MTMTFVIGVTIGMVGIAANARSPAIAAIPAAAVATIPDGACLGTRQSPSASVRLRAARCENQPCGTIVLANDKARADARHGGADVSIGTQLFDVFTATLVAADSIGVKGCATQTICRNQV